MNRWYGSQNVWDTGELHCQFPPTSAKHQQVQVQQVQPSWDVSWTFEFDIIPANASQLQSLLHNSTYGCICSTHLSLVHIFLKTMFLLSVFFHTLCTTLVSHTILLQYIKLTDMEGKQSPLTIIWVPPSLALAQNRSRQGLDSTIPSQFCSTFVRYTRPVSYSVRICL